MKTKSSTPRKSNRTTQVSKSIKFKKAKDIRKPRSWAIYGRAGTGKTTLSSTFPGPICLVDVRDEGTDSIRDVDNVHVFEPETMQDMEDLLDHLKQNPEGFKTVAIDTMTQLQQMAVEEIASSKRLRGSQNAGDWGTMTKQDWGDVAGRLKKLIIEYRNLPMEVVFIAQEREFNFDDGDGGDVAVFNPEVGPSMSPSVSRHLCASVSVIAVTYIRSRKIKKKVKGRIREREKTEYCLRLRPDDVYVTKVRKPKTKEVSTDIVDPTYEEIIDIIEGE